MVRKTLVVWPGTPAVIVLRCSFLLSKVLRNQVEVFLEVGIPFEHGPLNSSVGYDHFDEVAAQVGPKSSFTQPGMREHRKGKRFGLSRPRAPQYGR